MDGNSGTFFRFLSCFLRRKGWLPLSGRSCVSEGTAYNLPGSVRKGSTPTPVPSYTFGTADFIMQRPSRTGSADPTTGYTALGNRDVVKA